MITSLSVEHFKAISSCELSNLKRINLFGGKNNTGKSTVIEALFFFLDRQNPQSFIRMHNWRGEIPTSMTSFDIFAPIFYNYNMDKPVKISVKEGADMETLTLHSVAQNNTTIKIKPKEVFSISGTNTKSLEHNQVEIAVEFSGPTKGKYSKQKIIHTIHDEENMDVKINKQAPIKSAIFLSSRSPINPNENAIRFGELVKKNKENLIMDYLQVIEPRLRSITAIQQPNSQAVLYGDIGLDVKIPLHYMGDGITRILSIILAIFNNPNGIVFIDEIENGLHHSVLVHVWEMLDQASKQNNCQLFITTHSYECLASLVDSAISKEDVNYIRLERKGQQIVSKEYGFDNLQIAIENGWEVR